mgnify:CR=1 FL=1
MGTNVASVALASSSHVPLPPSCLPACLPCRVSELEAALAAADADRASQRQQMARLKQQMLNEQDDEDDKIRWVGADRREQAQEAGGGWGWRGAPHR